ncbi:MAG: diguanylate cyclase [Gammaproteobacteria bacterium]|nr:diguanylate cyclase [Gammaproteobacteria bacterium]
MADDSEALAWKQKYIKRLDELEAKEESWQATESLLRQCISRLTIIAEESHGGVLKQLLLQLRGAIRDGTRSDDLKSVVDAISQSLLRLDQRDSGSVEIQSVTDALLEVVNSTHFPLAVRPFVKGFTNRIHQGENETALLRAFMDLLEDMFNQLEGDRESEDRRGIIGSLLKSKGREEATQQSLTLAKRVMSRFISQLLSHHPESEEISSHLNESQQEAELLVLVDEIQQLLQKNGLGLNATSLTGLPPHEVLIRLLEQLDIPEDWSDEFKAIKQQLALWRNGGDLEAIILSIAELLRKIQWRVQQEKGELEQFLKQMTQRLQAIDVDIKSGYESHRSSFRHGVDLKRNVDDQVSGISASIDIAQDLETLKRNVQQRIETIEQHMESFAKVEEQRIGDAEKRVKELTKKLQVMQGESKRLHKVLESERQQAYVDALTGIPNRLAYNERVEQEEHRWKRYGSPLCLVVWDIDKFKSVNDTYGHQAGDKVLAVVAKVLRRKIRETDFIARYGGEEFVLLMPETTLEHAMPVVNTLRQSVEACEFHFHNQRVPITISCGVAELRGEEDSHLTAFARADKALYQAKTEGRNRCCSDLP